MAEHLDPAARRSLSSWVPAVQLMARDTVVPLAGKVGQFLGDCVLWMIPSWVHPLSVTVVRALLVVPVCVYRHDPLIAVSLFVGSSICDILDGFLARARKQGTTLGEFLDPVSDKIAVLGALWIACEDRVWLPIKLAFTFIEVLLVGVRFVKEQRGISVGSHLSGKIKTWVVSFAISFVLTQNSWLHFLSFFVFAGAFFYALRSFTAHVNDIRNRKIT